MAQDEIAHVRVIRRRLGGAVRWGAVAHSALLVETAGGKQHIVEMMGDGKVHLHVSPTVEARPHGKIHVSGTGLSATNATWTVQAAKSVPTVAMTVAQLQAEMQRKADARGEYNLLTNNCHCAQEDGRRALGVAVENSYSSSTDVRPSQLVGRGVPQSAAEVLATLQSMPASGPADGIASDLFFVPVLECMFNEDAAMTQRLCKFLRASGRIDEGPSMDVVTRLADAQAPQFEQYYRGADESTERARVAAGNLEVQEVLGAATAARADAVASVDAARAAMADGVAVEPSTLDAHLERLDAAAREEAEDNALALEEETEAALGEEEEAKARMYAELSAHEHQEERRERGTAEALVKARDAERAVGREESNGERAERQLSSLLQVSAATMMAVALLLESNPITFAEGLTLAAEALALFTGASTASGKAAVHAAKSTRANRAAGKADQQAKVASAAARAHATSGSAATAQHANAQSTAAAHVSSAAGTSDRRRVQPTRTL